VVYLKQRRATALFAVFSVFQMWHPCRRHTLARVLGWPVAGIVGPATSPTRYLRRWFRRTDGRGSRSRQNNRSSKEQQRPGKGSSANWPLLSKAPCSSLSRPARV